MEGRAGGSSRAGIAGRWWRRRCGSVSIFRSEHSVGGICARKTLGVGVTCAAGDRRGFGAFEGLRASARGTGLTPHPCTGRAFGPESNAATVLRGFTSGLLAGPSRSLARVIAATCRVFASSVPLTASPGDPSPCQSLPAGHALSSLPLAVPSAVAPLARSVPTTRVPCPSKRRASGGRGCVFF